LHTILPRAEAEHAFVALDAICEEEAWPLANIERDDESFNEISVYLDRADEARARRLFSRIVPAFDVEELPDIDWVAKSLEGLKAVRAGRFFVHGAHERRCLHAGEIGIEIEAGQAFGTGHHGTTAGCLELIEQIVRRERPRNALDLGTGSAVLAIAIARLARIPVLATDIDPVATQVADENVRLNRAAAYVDCVTAAGFHHPALAGRAPFDLIVANILARPLMRLAPQMKAHLTPGGSLILSGILDRQRNAVVASYVGQGFRHVHTIHRNGWSTIHLKR
jgi:ribosomal protein L11 methyltransferase